MRRGSLGTLGTLDEGGLTSLSGHTPFVKLPDLCFELRDPRVAIVRHSAHPSPAPLLRDGARIARHRDAIL